MRLDTIYKASFFQGIGLGLGLAGVAYLAVEAFRRKRYLAASVSAPFIDGVRPTDHISLQVQPQQEGNSTTRRLESEMPDEVSAGQRW